MKKKAKLVIPVVVLLAVVALLDGPSRSGAQAHPSSFSDVKESDAGHVAIEALVAEKLMAGDANGNFYPHSPVLRKSAAKILVKWRAEPAAEAVSHFSDVDAAYQPFVDAAYAKDWIQGYADGTYRPEGSLTREQMFTILIRVIGQDARAKALTAAQINSTLGQFLDQEAVSPGARRYLAYAVRSGLVVGNGGRLMPVAKVTKSQLALVIYRTDHPVKGVAIDPNGLTAQEKAKADFMTKYLFRPRNSPITGEMVVNNEKTYGIPAIAQLVIMAAETSLGDPRNGGTLARVYNFGCLRHHGANTPWGLLSSGSVRVAGKTWYKFPNPAIGMAAFGRYLKVGVDGFYLPILKQAHPNWSKFANTYYGRGVPGLASYISKLERLENSFRAQAKKYGVSL